MVTIFKKASKKRSVEENVEELEALCSVDGIVKWKTVCTFLKKLKVRTYNNPATPLLLESRISSGYLHTHARRGVIHRSQDMEATQTSTDRWIDKEKAVSLYNRILFQLQKKGNPVLCDNVDKPWGQYAKWSKPVTKRQILHDSIYMRSLKELNL